VSGQIVRAGLVPAILAAHESGLLEAMERQAGSAEELAGRLGLDPRATRLLCDALAAGGACERLAPDRFGRRSGLDDPIFSHLPEMLRTGEPLALIDDRAVRGEKYAQVVDRLAERFAGAAQSLAAQLPPAGSILDVGAGSAVWSLAMAARAPSTRVIALDLAEVIPRALANAARLGLSDRVSALPGSFFEVLPAERVDRVVMANVLHLETEEKAAQLVSRLAPALQPGGELVIIDCLPDGSPEAERTRAFYALHLGLRTRLGRVHTPAELASYCERAGLAVERIVRVDGIDAGLGALIARSPTS
jgi:ubiquinone/menaquinone biosynthesis C-methylase UbiE